MKSNTEKDSIRCPLCSLDDSKYFFKDKFREYFRCSNCSLIFVPPEFHPTRSDEKARYEEHNNDPDDPRYREFLERIVPPIKERVLKEARGLDFGCGPTPLLASILTENGFEMEIYDSFYETEKDVLDQKYDFIVSTEVLEHLSQPLIELKKLLSKLKPGGILAIMTLPFDSSIDFRGWHYKNDSTHISFYSLETFAWLSETFGMSCETVGKDIFIFSAKD